MVIPSAVRSTHEAGKLGESGANHGQELVGISWPTGISCINKNRFRRFRLPLTHSIVLAIIISYYRWHNYQKLVL